VSSQVLGEKQEVEAKPSQESEQNKPKRPTIDDPRQKPAVQGKSKTQRMRSEVGKMDRDHHGQPVVNTTDRGGSRGRSGRFSLPVSFSLRGLLFSCAIFQREL